MLSADTPPMDYDWEVSVINECGEGQMLSGAFSTIVETLTVTTTVCDGASSVAMTGPWWGWDPSAGPVASDNGDGTWTFTFTPAPTDDME